MAIKSDNILFLCTGNSCRSQMAEGFARSILGNRYEVYSAGIEKHGLNPFAIQVMQEEGIDISVQTSNTVDEIPVAIDLVITVCGHAHESCPAFGSSPKVLHVGFDDPPKLAAMETSEERKLQHYRRVRDEIKAFIQRWDDLALQ